MGQLFYSGAVLFNAHDRTLRHLEVVIRSKMRRGESFPIEWFAPEVGGGGRCSAWISPGVAVNFSYTSNVPGALNENWLRVLRSAADGAGLLLVPEATSATDG